MAVPPPNPGPQSDKAALRTLLRGRRRAFVSALGPARRHALLEALADRVIPHAETGMIVTGYVAAGAETDPGPLLARLHDRGIALALPHIPALDAPMRFLRWSPDAPLVSSGLGFLQPADDSPEAEPDLILTPLVGFDRTRGRIGQGAGFYDRAFARHTGARRIGLAWSVQEVESVPMDPWDMPLDAIATEREWIA